MDNIRCPVFLCAFAVDRSSRQRKSYVHSSRRRLGVFTASRRDHHKLASIHFIRDRRCVAREGQRCLPQQFARGLVKGAELLVEIGCPNEYQAACGHDRPAVVFRARVFLSICGKLRILAQGNLPGVFAGIEVNGVQRSPRWQDCRISLRIQELVISGKAIFHRVQVAAHQR